MQAIAAVRTTPTRDDSDGAPCPACGLSVEQPASSDYRGLGRIEHTWQCQSCGVKFLTSGRMGGCIELEPEPVAATAA